MMQKDEKCPKHPEQKAVLLMVFFKDKEVWGCPICEEEERRKWKRVCTPTEEDLNRRFTI